ncbi:MAG TPA: hypothetical protein VKT75_13345 [Acidobacteriaceae bacterium]|nr:hypothetical protein [Acidobacteriaceae bacterium]
MREGTNEAATPEGIREHAAPSPFAILSPVLLLYGIYVLCTVALVWTAIAITRHIVQHRRLSRSHTEHHDENV